MRERVDRAKANGLGRAGLSAGEVAMAGMIDHATLAVHAPALDDHPRTGFYG